MIDIINSVFFASEAYTTLFYGPGLSFWVKIVVILWICPALQAVLFLSAWEKSRDTTPNIQKLENM